MREDAIEGLIPGLVLKELDNYDPINNALVFGSGDSFFPVMVNRYLGNTQVTAYDKNQEKIQSIKERSNAIGAIIEKTSSKRFDEYFDVIFTHTKPSFVFDFVFALAVLHENPNELIDEALSFLRLRGFIGVVDYDMKSMSYDEFYQRWGYIRIEQRERELLGDLESYRMHTSFGLDDCIQIMRNKGVDCLFSRAGLKSQNWSRAPLPTKHFVYLGKKIN